MRDEPVGRDWIQPLEECERDSLERGRVAPAGESDGRKEVTQEIYRTQQQLERAIYFFLLLALACSSFSFASLFASGCWNSLYLRLLILWFLRSLQTRRSPAHLMRVTSFLPRLGFSGSTLCLSGFSTDWYGG